MNYYIHDVSIIKRVLLQIDSDNEGPVLELEMIIATESVTPYIPPHTFTAKAC